MHTSILKRFDELIKRGQSLLPASNTIDWDVESNKWKLNSLNILEKTFGKNSNYYEHYVSYSNFGVKETKTLYEISILESAKEEIEKGFLYKIENLISSDFFDSIFDHAEHLLAKGHKDPAAILGRVVIENTLKNLAERESIVLPDNVKLSKVNEILWKKELYNKITWRLIQGYVALGNYAAHGDFEKYGKNEVEDMLLWVKKNLMNL